MNLSWYVPKANVDHTICGQGTAISTLDHSATTPRASCSEVLYPPKATGQGRVQDRQDTVMAIGITSV